MPFFSIALGFLRGNWKYVLVALAVVCAFFYARHIVSEHDKAVRAACNSEWSQKIADASEKNLKSLQKVRKRNDEIRIHGRPDGADDLIGILRDGKFSEGQP